MMTRRNAFTLLELLVVVAIIAVLSALSAGVLFRVQASQQEKLSGDRVTQLQKMVMQQYSAALDTARATQGSMPEIVKEYARFDPDTAKAIWAYLHLRKNFPQTVAEARSPITLPGTAVGRPAQLIFPAPAVFLDRLPAAASSLPATEQSAVCLYVSLAELNRRGMESGITDSMVKMWPPNDPQLKVFTDTFNVPIGFVRFMSVDEMGLKPYVNNPSLAAKDPLDPFGKLIGLPAQYQTDLRSVISTPSMPHSMGGRTFNNSNFIPSVISYGLNKRFDLDNNIPPQPNGDDLLGFRLMVEGRTGN